MGSSLCQERTKDRQAKIARQLRLENKNQDEERLRRIVTLDTRCFEPLARVKEADIREPETDRQPEGSLPLTQRLTMF